VSADNHSFKGQIMIRKLLALAGLLATLDACTGPPPPQMADAFKNIYNGNSAAVPANAPVTVTPPVALIFSENVEAHIGAVKDANEYWGKIVPASLTNTVGMADNNPLYFSGKILELLKRHFPSATPVHDFNEAVQQRKRAVILVDLRMEYGMRSGQTSKMDIDLYFFDSAMNPVSKINGHAEFTIPYPAVHSGMQQMTNAAIAQLDSKISATVR
jgi:hypothetical protein